MGERKGQNHYYPPDFDPKKHKSLNAYHGVHPLRERAHKLDQGVLVIRFEMPYNIWCDGCKAHIAMGVRYNAEKSKVGMYYSTPIQQFKMKCHLCDQYFVIHTDPKNHDYVIQSGARRKEQRWDMADNEQIVTEEREDIKRMQLDPMFSLEHESNDKSKVAKLMPTLRELEEAKSDWKDDYRLNSMMRGILRNEKKVVNEQKQSDQKLIDKWNLSIDLVKESDEDVKIAALYKFNTLDDEKSVEEKRAEKRKTLELESIFEADCKKARRLSEPIKLTSKSNSKSKESQLSSLKDKLKKSVMEKKMSATGFNLNNSSNGLILDTNYGKSASPLLNSLVRKTASNLKTSTSPVQTGVDATKHSLRTDASNKDNDAMSKTPTAAAAALVSNDYGSGIGSDDSNSG